MRTHTCLECGAVLKHFDFVSRSVLPDEFFPYKQYSAEIINGVLDGSITSDTLEYEDYPCEATMHRWLNEFH